MRSGFRHAPPLHHGEEDVQVAQREPSADAALPVCDRIGHNFPVMALAPGRISCLSEGRLGFKPYSAPRALPPTTRTRPHHAHAVPLLEFRLLAKGADVPRREKAGL